MNLEDKCYVCESKPVDWLDTKTGGITFNIWFCVPHLIEFKKYMWENAKSKEELEAWAFLISLKYLKRIQKMFLIE